MKTKLKWQVLPADLDLLPQDKKFLVITRDGDMHFADYDGEDIMVHLAEHLEAPDEVDVVYWARASIPDEA